MGRDGQIFFLVLWLVTVAALLISLVLLKDLRATAATKQQKPLPVVTTQNGLIPPPPPF